MRSDDLCLEWVALPIGYHRLKQNATSDMCIVLYQDVSSLVSFGDINETGNLITFINATVL